MVFILWHRETKWKGNRRIKETKHYSVVRNGKLIVGGISDYQNMFHIPYCSSFDIQSIFHQLHKLCSQTMFVQIKQFSCNAIRSSSFCIRVCTSGKNQTADVPKSNVSNLVPQACMSLFFSLVPYLLQARCDHFITLGSCFIRHLWLQLKW